MESSNSKINRFKNSVQITKYRTKWAFAHSQKKKKKWAFA